MFFKGIIQERPKRYVATGGLFNTSGDGNIVTRQTPLSCVHALARTLTSFLILGSYVCAIYTDQRTSDRMVGNPYSVSHSDQIHFIGTVAFFIPEHVIKRYCRRNTLLAGDRTPIPFEIIPSRITKPKINKEVTTPLRGVEN